MGSGLALSRAPERQMCAPCASGLRLQRTLHTLVHGVQRRRSTDIESVPLLPAEAQIGHRLREMDLAQQFPILGVAAHAVLIGVAPTHGAPDATFGVATHAVG